MARLARAAGPWAQFDPTGFEQGWVQKRLDRAQPTPRGRTRSRLDAVLEALPASNAAGLERHLVSVGLNVPPLVTRDEMIQFVRPFAWLLDRGREGLPLDGAHLPAGLAQEWADACGTTVAQLPVVQRTARELRFVRTLQGRLLTMKSAVPLADDPLALWDALADKLPEAGDGRLRFVNALVLLAIADGSIADGGEDGGLDRIARAHDVRNDIDEDAWRARSWWEDRDFFLPADPSVSVASRVEVDSIRPLVLPLTERLEPLGLAARTRDTWRASRALQGFAQAALTTPAAISLSGGYGF
ncbi:hypothetical protein [Microbacterium elymi]|uniref:Uncharacterized protein n=1 Tax=Microbacterium elymi TaxID=2909587 RepID=A0ABY5NMT8_9MICO|nr:hypothetical protein [Microbacterium elymi]UUT36443.1 hypothetical protein L2X98_26375 [Microbacterium elymi]